MYIPFITKPHDQIINRRKGGGGGKGGGGSSGGKGSTSSSGSSGESDDGDGISGGSGISGTTGSSGGKTSSVPVGGSSASSKSTATTYGSGGGKAVTIPTGELFAGRSAGGASRDQVYGSRMYGSGYPGYNGPGVTGRGFPFWFWPVIWGGTAGAEGQYLYDHEYGDSFNTSRPGGAMAEATFASNSTGMVFHLISDNSTVTALISSVGTNCSSYLASSSSTSASPLNASDPASPQPQQAIQYYRSCSVVLTLDGYNNSATFSSSPNTTADSPLPSGIDTTLLNCLNYTIGEATPLINGTGSRFTPPCLGLVSLVWMLLFLMHYA